METTSENTETKAKTTTLSHYAGSESAPTWTSEGTENGRVTSLGSMVRCARRRPAARLRCCSCTTCRATSSPRPRSAKPDLVCRNAYLEFAS
jgi:hypothetical protein